MSAARPPAEAPGRPAGGDPRPEADALQACLAGEHAAVYGYGVLGARLPAAQRRLALAALDGHRARRDQLAAALRARGGDPVLPPGAYDVAVANAPEALALAAQLEEGMGVRWRDLVTGTADAALRRVAVDALVETAVRAAQWRQQSGTRPMTQAFPGSV